MSDSSCCFLTCTQVSQKAGKVVWYSHHFKNIPPFVVIHTVKGFSTVNKTEVDVSLEFPCFFYDPADVGNLISGSSAFSKTSLNIWKFTVHALLKPGLENFEHYFISVWDECSCAVVWASSPITSWQIDEETMKVTDFIFLVSKILHILTAAMELKDAWSLEEKLWQM